jgi:hypothetical protein
MKLHSSVFVYPSDVLRKEKAVARNYADSVVANANPKHVNCRDPEFVLLKETTLHTVLRALTMEPAYLVSKPRDEQRWVLDESSISNRSATELFADSRFESFCQQFEGSGGNLEVMKPVACVDSFPSPNWH